MGRKEEIIALFASVFADKFADDEVWDVADRLTWADPSDVEFAMREHRITSRFKPTLGDLKAIINKRIGTQPRREPPRDKSHADVLAEEAKLPPAAAVLVYWRGVWSRYAGDAVQRELGLASTGPARDLFEAQLAGMRNKCVSGAVASLNSLGASFDLCSRLAEQVTADTANFDRTINWLRTNPLPRSPQTVSIQQTRRPIFGMVDDILRPVAPLVDPREKPRQLKELASEVASQVEQLQAGAA